jgi:hypothetical protein
MLQICIFEDQNYTSLFPLTFLRPAYDLLMGQSKLAYKVMNRFPESFLTLHARPYVKGYIKRYYPNASFNIVNQSAPCWFINGRTVMDDYLFSLISQSDLSHNLLLIQKGVIIAAYLNGMGLSTMKYLLESIPSNQDLITALRPLAITKDIEDVTILSAPEHIITLNPKAIMKDFSNQNYYGIIKGDVHAFAVLYEENNIFIDMGTIVEDFVVIDARKGPVFIEENVIIESHSRLEGPLYVGANSHILGGKIKVSSIGPYSKVCGEVSHSVIQGYSNKAHHGFLGHSWLGDWVNLGANTTVSNLKNNYKPVQLLWENQARESSETFLGSFIGDHSKTSIGTLLNTGTMVGFASVLLESQLHPKFISPFSWGKSGQYTKHDLLKLLQTAEQVMKRRGFSLSESERESISYAYKFYETH